MSTMIASPNRAPASPAGQPVRDDHGVVIGWCWWDGEDLHCTDDRWGVETVHTGGVMLACSRAIRAVRVRVQQESAAKAVRLCRMIALADELTQIDRSITAGDRPERWSARLAAIDAELSEIARAGE